MRAAAGGVRCGERASPAGAGDTTGTDRAARAPALRRLHADATRAAARHGCARRHNDRPERRAPWRQACQNQRRAVPAGRRRPGNARTDPGYRQHAGDSAARQSRRRSKPPAEIRRGLPRIAPAARLTCACAVSYMPRVRGLRYIESLRGRRGGVAQLVRARES